ncbi:hypothetical protein BHM03_00037502 [Ensete ventricosum]|nr:hypothetical protein BHM03_00037502 [Ensete ventricosum]
MLRRVEIGRRLLVALTKSLFDALGLAKIDMAESITRSSYLWLEEVMHAMTALVIAARAPVACTNRSWVGVVAVKEALATTLYGESMHAQGLQRSRLPAKVVPTSKLPMGRDDVDTSCAA